MSQLATIRAHLAEYSIRGIPDFAEILVAEALGGQRVDSGVNKGFDVVAPEYGRIEVKCRRLPMDGRREDRVELHGTKKDGFDYLAIVIFYPNHDVKGAVLVPYEVVWPMVESRKYQRIHYEEARLLEESIDISELVSAASQK